MKVNDRLNVFSEELNLIQNPKYKELLKEIIENAPAYFFTMPASTSGKYHPALSLGEGGLVRHTKVVAKLMIMLSKLKMFKFSDDEKDLLLIAAIAHDMLKKGENKTGHTVNDHPQFAYDFVLKCVLKVIGDNWDNDYIYTCLLNPIKTHMGEWGVQLPENEEEKLLHICDYISAQKELTYNFNEEEYIKTIPKTGSLTIEFGKYKGKTLDEVRKINLDYLIWVKDNADKVPGAKEMARKYLEEQKLI